MARVVIPIDLIPLNGGSAQGTGVAASPANDHEAQNDGNVFIVGINSNAVAQTATIVSVNDPYGRVGDTTMTIPALAGGFNGVAMAGPFNRSIWNQGGGSQIYIDTAALAADVKFYAFRYAPGA